jgi:uncharacterized protein
MKWLALLVFAACASAAPKPVAPPVTSKLEMKGYTLVLLRRGPAWTPEETPETKRLFEGHMANIIAMGKSGKLLIAGPTDVAETERTAVAGIFIFDAERPDVDEMLKADPAIAAGRLVADVMPWYGPAGITYPGKL